VGIDIHFGAPVKIGLPSSAGAAAVCISGGLLLGLRIPVSWNGRARMEFSRRESANYLASLSAELVTVAERAGLDTLAYIFRMAILEARSHERPEQTAQDAA
jgi:hypothetical protein